MGAKATLFHDVWYNRPGPTKRFRYLFWWTALVLFLAVLAAIVGPIFRYGFVILAHDGEHESKTYHGDHIQYPDNYDDSWSSATSNVSYLVAILRIASFDLANEKYTVSVKISDLRGHSTPENLLTRDLRVIVPEAGGVREFKAGSDYMPFFISDEKLFEDGNLNMYPFDEYHATLGLSVFDAETGKALPVIGVLEGDIPGYKVHVISHGTNLQLAAPVLHLRETFLNKAVAKDSVLPIPGVTFQFIVERSHFTLSWSIFVIIMMWIISIVQLCIAMQFYLRGREFNVGLMTFSSSFLFSLPSFRNTQPNIPTVGVAADALGFYYNMLFVVIAIVCNIMMYLRAWKPKAPESKDKSEKDEKDDVKAGENGVKDAEKGLPKDTKV